MSTALAALRAGVLALLEAEGEDELAALVKEAEVELVAPGEPWSMGSREVVAHRAALVVGPAAYARLAADPAELQVIRGAFARAMRSPATELAELHLVLRLPVLDRPWHHVYREAPVRERAQERPAVEAVREGAAALLEAQGEPVAAAIVRRAALEVADVQGTSTPLARWVARLDPRDLAAAQRSPRLDELVRKAIHDAAARAGEAVMVDLGTALGAG